MWFPAVRAYRCLFLSCMQILPEAYDPLREITSRLEKHYKDVQDFEFTVRARTASFTCCRLRNGKRTGLAAVRIAIQMVDEGLSPRKKRSSASTEPTV